ncbi:MAG: NAD-dependent epimerase/dehydratase family protein [Chitinophagales bacterium]
MMKRALVTGANGFVGSHLVRRLLAEGWQVRAMVLPGTEISTIANLGAEIFYANMLDGNQIKSAVVGIDVVYHLAAIPSLAWSESICDVNKSGLVEVLSHAIEAKVKRFVFLSSLVVHGFSHFEDADESTPLLKAGRFTRPYIRSKIDGEEVVANCSTEIETVIVRPGFMIYGPNDQLTTKQTLNLINRGSTLFRIGKTAPLLSFVYVENLAYGIFCAGSHQAAAGKTYVITDVAPRSKTLPDIWKSWADALSKNIRIVTLPYAPALFLAILTDVFYFLFLRTKMPLLNYYMVQVATNQLDFTCEKAVREIGYHQVVSFEEGVKRSVKMQGA